MATTLNILDCNVQPNSIRITYSDAVDKTSAAGSTSAIDPGNYRVFDPSANLSSPTLLANAGATVSLGANDDPQTVTFLLDKPLFNAGDFVLLEVSDIALSAAPGQSALVEDPVSISRQVPGKSKTARLTSDVEDAVSYPILTEEIGYRSSPGGPGGGGGGNNGGGTSGLGQIALKAVSDVLGWKANSTDAKGFVGALTQAFTLKDVEGHVQSTWTPRTYAVQTDLGGGITGAQASLYMRAKDALDQSLSLLDGLYPLDPEADPEYVKALREMARSQMTEIVREFGAVGLPSTLRIDTYFEILLGQNPAQLSQSSTPVKFDPDAIQGTLGSLRDTYGIFFAGNPFNNSVEDEQDITNFRVISDYMTSLMQSWIANRNFFRLSPNNPAFFGTQLVLISRQFNVICETVSEVRFALDSVFIGPSERQTLLLEFADGSSPMFLEDVLVEVEKFSTDEGPRLLRDGGKISVTNNILPVVESLQNLVQQAQQPVNLNVLPDGFRTVRVRRSLDDLKDQLNALINLTEQVEQQVPAAEGRLAISNILGFVNGNNQFVSIVGDGFNPHAIVTFHSAYPIVATSQVINFFSAQRIDVAVSAVDWKTLQQGQHEITVANPAGDSLTITVPNGIPTNPFQPAQILVKRDARKGKAARSAAYKALQAQKATGFQPPPVIQPPAVTAAAMADMEKKLAQLQKTQNDLQTSQSKIASTVDGLETSIVAKIAELLKKPGSK